MKNSYPPEKLRVQSTAQPNGDYTKYSEGMEKPKILPSNDPRVLKMLLQRMSTTTTTRKR